MVQSMTGYGCGARQGKGASVSVEIRTVNHRFLDLHIRLGREYAALENEVQQLVRERLSRGRVDLTVNIQADLPVEMEVNTRTVKSYLLAAQKLKDEFGLGDSLDLRTLLELPGVVQSRDSDQPLKVGADPELTGLVRESVREALETVIRMRSDEGTVLGSEMRTHLETIRTGNRQIRGLLPATVEEFRQKIEQRLQRLLPPDGIDPQRAAQEVALLADKADIAEEVSRLDSHILQFESLLDSDQQVGKRLDFLLQEMQRETNTIMAKTANLEITRLGLGIKAAIETLREQVQNVE